jgi:hypothetical protein
VAERLATSQEGLSSMELVYMAVMMMMMMMMIANNFMHKRPP